MTDDPVETPIRVLLVDDDLELCELMQGFLSQHGLVVQTVHDGLSGMRAVTEGGFDVVTLDVMLPGIDGFEDPPPAPPPDGRADGHADCQNGDRRQD